LCRSVGDAAGQKKHAAAARVLGANTGTVSEDDHEQRR
jgi:hypothetical protein